MQGRQELLRFIYVSVPVPLHSELLSLCVRLENMNAVLSAYMTHYVDVDPNSTVTLMRIRDSYFYLMRMRIQIRIQFFTLMRIRIRSQILASN